MLTQGKTRIGGLVTAAVATSMLLASPIAGARPVYVTSPDMNQVYGFDVADDGTMIQLTGTPVNAESTPWGGVMSPDGGYLYIGRQASNELTALELDADGNPIGAQAYPNVPAPYWLVMDPLGYRLYVAGTGEDRQIQIFDVDGNGNLGNQRSADGAAVSESYSPAGLLMTPNREHLYSVSNAAIWIHDVDNLGNLGNIRAYTPGGQRRSSDLVISPDGQHLYAGWISPTNKVLALDIGADGSLGNPRLFDPPEGTDTPSRLAMSPDGRWLFVYFATGQSVVAYSVDASGNLSVASATVPGPGAVRDLAVLPNGRHLMISYADYNAGAYSLGLFDIASNGELGNPREQQLGVVPTLLIPRPNQGPRAAFDWDVAAAGEATQFDAIDTDQDGSIARYDWEFGDGTTLPDGGPTPSHVYAEAGEYTVRLTVTDNEGCSGQDIYDGHQMVCDAGKGAAIQHTIDVPDAVPLCFGVPATIIGTEGPDLLHGTAGDDVIVGLGGSDTIFGGDGNDLICGGDGDDRIYGGSHRFRGGDECDGGTGSNTLSGCENRSERESRQ